MQADVVLHTCLLVCTDHASILARICVHVCSDESVKLTDLWRRGWCTRDTATAGLNDCSFYTTVCFSEFRQLGKQKIMGVQIPWGGTHIIKRFPTWNSFKLTFFTKWSWIAGMSTELRHSVKTIRTKRLLFLQSHVVASACRYIHNVSAWQHILQMNLSYRKHHGRILGGPKSEVIDCTCLKSQDWFV